MSELRIAVIGYGGMGTHHAAYLSAGQVPGTRLSAIADPDPAARERARARHPEVPVSDSAEAVLLSPEIDGVLIATPHYFHPPYAIQALKAGKHVLIEKPAGVYTRQVREMNEVAAASDRVFGIMFQQRTIGAHQKMRDLVASGALGAIKRAHYVITGWYRPQAYYDSGGWRATWEGEGGGVLLNQSPHNLDLWQWICGMPKRVRAFCSFGKYHDIEVEDDVTAYVEYENGATGVFITTTGEAPGSKSFEIAGDRGKLVLADGKLTFWRTTVPVSQHLRECPQGFTKPECWTCDIPTRPGDEHVGITRNWADAIRTGAPLLARGEEGINGVSLANAMLLSAWTDNWVDLPLDDDLYYAELRERIASSRGKEAAGGKVMDVAGTF